MLPDLKWVWLPFTSSHEERLRAELNRLAASGQKAWIFGECKEIAAASIVLDRIAARAEGLLSILAIPFSLFAFSLAVDDRKDVTSSVTALSLVISLIFLFRCVLVTWTSPHLLGDNEEALKHYVATLVARARAFYIGTTFAFVTLVLLAIQVAVRIYG